MTETMKACAHLDRDKLLGAARRRTGLDDFGDGWFLESKTSSGTPKYSMKK